MDWEDMEREAAADDRRKKRDGDEPVQAKGPKRRRR